MRSNPSTHAVPRWASARSERAIIVFVHHYDDSNGGTLVLFELAKRLRSAGVSVLVWPANKPGQRIRSWGDAVRLAKAVVRRALGRQFDFGPFDLPVARWRDIPGSIVVYPEGVSGNPVGAPFVVRWFLHRPGFHTGTVDYGTGETYFYYQDAFNDPSINPDTEHRLQVSFWNPHYVRTNQHSRAGVCYMVRKGVDAALGAIRPDEVAVDGLSHEETAAAFNQYAFFRCFDPYTMYAAYAAVCGCVPVVEPVEGLTKEEWYPRESDRYGVAYGWDESEIAWARETRGLLLDRLGAARETEDAMVLNFVDILRRRYP